jgi:transmembrane sensor
LGFSDSSYPIEPFQRDIPSESKDPLRRFGGRSIVNTTDIMSDPNPSSDPSSPREQAIRWMVRLHSGEATDADRCRLDAWLAQHPIHRREFEQLTNIWKTLDRTKPLLEMELNEAETVYQTGSDPVRRPLLLRAGWLATTAGALAILLMLVTSWWWTLPPKAVRYHTAKGEQQQVTLADGSSVTLNTASEIIAQFSDKERLVVLDHGEVWFEVRHDERRPFRVQVANGAIHDIGTEFIVTQSSEKVFVSVLEGIVEVRILAADKSPSATRPAILHHGEQVWYGADGRMSAIGSFNQSTVGAWREGKLVFQAQPLEQVLTELGRYRSEEIRVLDPGLKNIPVSGVFNIRDVRSFVQALQDALPLQATWVNPQLVLVEQAPTAGVKSKPSTR